MALALVDEARRCGARLQPACQVLGLTNRTVQRWRKEGDEAHDRREDVQTKKQQPNALSESEQQEVLDALNSEAYRDMGPQQVVVRLADEGRYVASESTMYRILRKKKQLTHRGLTKPKTARPVPRLKATAPNQVWSWDITYLSTTVRGCFVYLYMAMDIWSRRIVAAAVHETESAEHAVALLSAACRDNDIGVDQVTWHSDNGSPMRASTLLSKLQQLGIVPSFSRPRVSNDNPYSESLFKTVKYTTTLPLEPFASIEQAREWVEAFVAWYNSEHLHSSIRYVTPDQRHLGQEQQILVHRHAVYQAAKARNPNRWSTGRTRNWTPVGAVHINPDEAMLNQAGQDLSCPYQPTQLEAGRDQGVCVSEASRAKRGDRKSLSTVGRKLKKAS